MIKQNHKRIVSIFVHCFPPAKGGLEYLVGEIKKILDQKCEVHVITGQGLTLDSYKTFKDFTTDNSNNVHRLELNYFWQRIANKFLNKIIFKIGFFSPFYFGPILKYSPEIKNLIAKSDLIIGAGMPTKMFYDAYYYAKKYNKKLICLPAYHNVSYYNHCHFFQKAFDYANKIIFLTNFEKAQIIKNYRIIESKTIINTYCPFTLDQIKEQAKINAKRKYNFSKPTIGYVGQISPRKNLYVFDNLLKAGYKVIFAGAETNGSHLIEKHFSQYISSKKLTMIYDFSESDKENVYSQFDIFINPSHEESLGIVNFEAIYYGIPIIVDINSAFAEFIPKDSVDLTDKKLLHHQILKNIKLPNDNYHLLEEYNRTIYSKKLFDLITGLL